MISLWSSSISFAAFYLIDNTIGLRVSDKSQEEGLDADIGVKQNCEIMQFQVR